MRSVAQTISYEIILALIFMIFIRIKISIITRELGVKDQIALLFPCGLVLLIVVLLAETHRTPFDFAEGESELVSGYNVEYGGVEFTILFLAEYLSIVFFSSLTVYLIFRLPLNSLSGVMITILVMTL
jgi:NADH-ubiquinone oxidoreductase chain 1